MEIQSTKFIPLPAVLVAAWVCKWVVWKAELKAVKTAAAKDDWKAALMAEWKVASLVASKVDMTAAKMAEL